MTVNTQVLIDSLPQGKLTAENYRIAESPVPEIGDGEVLVQTTAFAITAGTRAGLQGSAGYAGAPTTGVVMNGTGVGVVVESHAADFTAGDRVLGPTGWQATSALQYYGHAVSHATFPQKHFYFRLYIYISLFSFFALVLLYVGVTLARRCL